MWKTGGYLKLCGKKKQKWVQVIKTAYGILEEVESMWSYSHPGPWTLVQLQTSLLEASCGNTE